MKIFIQARKDGYNVLYPRPTPTEYYQFAADIQSESADNQSYFYGKFVYSIALSNGGYIFTKYVIGYDVQRSNLGNIGISVFIPNGKKLSGVDVKTLLDDLVKTYCVNYCPDYKFSDNQEDWLLFTSLANNYELRPESSHYAKNFTSGTKEPAFIYYKSEDELQEYFDKPFQEEYSDYRQIFFIDNSLQDKPSNPLNVFRNSGVELKDIDFKNEYYYLNNYSHNKGVTIIANGRNCSDGSYIRAKWQVEIKYSKDENCFFPIEAKGTLYDLDSEIHKYLKITDKNIAIKYDAFNPDPRKKAVLFEIKDSYGNPVNDAEIQIGSQQWETVSGYQHKHIFKGYELKQSLKVSAKKEIENLFSESITVSPENQIEPVILQKQKRVKIFACINNNAFPDFKFWIDDGKGWRENVTEYVFKGSDIEKPCTIEISKKEGYDSYSGKKENYCPATGDNPLYIPLKKAKQYCIENGKGSKKPECPMFSSYTDGRDIKKYIKPPKGHRLEGFELDENNKGRRDGTIIAIYEKEKKSFVGFLKKNKIWFIIISIAICLIIALLFLYFRCVANKGNTTSGKCESTECRVDSLNSTQKADSIKCLNQECTPEESNSEKKEESKKKTEDRQSKKQQSSIATTPEPIEPPVEQQDLPFVEQLKGDKLKKSTLEGSKNKELKGSIALALKLWDLDGKEGNSYPSYKKELEDDNVLNGSYLKKLVDSMCKKSNPKYVKNLDNNDQMKSLSHIESKLK